MRYLLNKVIFCAMLAACSLAAMSGCGSSDNSPFEHFERLPTVEELVTVPLGEFVVAVPIDPPEGARPVAPSQVQIEFFLHAAVLPKHRRSLESNHERLEGRFRDMVINVCRQMPLEDMLDPSLTTLKAHLADQMKPFIGDARIERIHIAEPQVKRL